MPKAENETAGVELSILMPCLNEAQTLADCIRKAGRFLTENNITGEILIADNGSTDGSIPMAEQEGARVVSVPLRGYGAALGGGIEAARGLYVIMGDADGSYDFSALGEFVNKLHQGYDLVVGNRYKGGIRPGAMPGLHRYLGNPLLSGLGRILFPCAIHDFHCGLRGFRRDAVIGLELTTTGMEYASEMIAKAVIYKLRMTEIPTILHPDGRNRRPHLRTWRDGWRHLKFMVLFKVRWPLFTRGRHQQKR